MIILCLPDLNDGCTQVEDEEDGCGRCVSGLHEGDRQGEEQVARQDQKQQDSGCSAEKNDERKSGWDSSTKAFLTKKCFLSDFSVDQL